MPTFARLRLWGPKAGGLGSAGASVASWRGHDALAWPAPRHDAQAWPGFLPGKPPGVRPAGAATPAAFGWLGDGAAIW
jgi:hypothetical protein